eukprot:TRINITY_DN33159_c0_g2_i1.p1 TRINITY_DN33159_c0_g2~~TRINITY_DN33159_c0_g2_i1.p1  ORF type:complete len:1336 (-),score=231.56 TRINITY_DN33159_c0_g2_i1:157-4164(-)
MADGLDGPGPSELGGKLFTWGYCTHGQLGLKEKVLGNREYVEFPTHAGVGELAEVEVRAASCGHFHTLVVDAKGNVFSFGRNERLQLARGDECEDSVERPGARPQRVKALSTSIVVDVRCGAFHSMASTVDGALFSWGCNKDGQLGRRTAYRADGEPGIVPLLEAKDATGLLRSFTAGLSHSAAVLSSGQVFTWGKNSYGQLGVQTVRPPEIADLPVFVNGVVGRQVAAADDVTLVLTVDNMVVAAGVNAYGQLGRPKDEQADADFGRFLPVETLQSYTEEAEDSLKMVACGGATCAAVTAGGVLFTWGGGVWGQLGRGNRSDSWLPSIVPGLPRVASVHIAQDHVLAQCVQYFSPEPSTHDAGAGTAGAQEEQVTGSQEQNEQLAEPSLWAWGRRRLLPQGLGGSAAAKAEPEAQCQPAEIPLEVFGLKHSVAGSSKPQVRAACGGAHSVAFLSHAQKEKQRRFTADRCARMSTVTGDGILGGRVSECLSFRIITRNEEGRDEKVGGLRFRVFAEHAAAPRSPSKRTSASPASAASVFDLRYITDCCDGTYDGAYSMSSTGSYRLHVHMLPDISAEDTEENNVCGEPLKGSPFQVCIDSGPAFAHNCQVRLKRGGRLKESPLDNGQSGDKVRVFEVEAGAEVAWDVLSFDVLGHAGTLKTDRFTAHIEEVESEGQASEAAAAKESESDLATSMGFPSVPNGGSPASMALRERIRQRNAERLWTMARSKFTSGSSSSRSAAKGCHLHVKQGKEAGRCEFRWTPGRIGNYKLAVVLLSPTSLKGEGNALGGSPFHVQVVGGKPVAGQSQLLVGAAAQSYDEVPTALSADTLSAEVPVRLLLCDKAGNVCAESCDPLKYVVLRVEAAAILGDKSEDPPCDLLQWSVTRRSGMLLSVSVTASSELLEVGRRCRRRNGSAVVQFFVSATDAVSHTRLGGSPCSVDLVVPAAALADVETSQHVAEVTAGQLQSASPSLENQPPSFTAAGEMDMKIADAHVMAAVESSAVDVTLFSEEPTSATLPSLVEPDNEYSNHPGHQDRELIAPSQESNLPVDDRKEDHSDRIETVRPPEEMPHTVQNQQHDETKRPGSAKTEEVNVVATALFACGPFDDEIHDVQADRAATTEQGTAKQLLHDASPPELSASSSLGLDSPSECDHEALAAGSAVPLLDMPEPSTSHPSPHAASLPPLSPATPREAPCMRSRPSSALQVESAEVSLPRLGDALLPRLPERSQHCQSQPLSPRSKKRPLLDAETNLAEAKADKPANADLDVRATAWMPTAPDPPALQVRRASASSMAQRSAQGSAPRRLPALAGTGGFIRMKAESSMAAPSPWPKAAR